MRFTPRRLKAVRSEMVNEKKKGGCARCSRTTINTKIQLIRKCFRWAVSEELLPSDLAHGLDAIENLREGE